MKFPNRLMSLLLALCLMFSMAAVGIVPAAAAGDSVETYAQTTIGGSAILHCFDWSYNNIKAALPDIAAAGYTAVQTSPVQSPKDYSASWTDAANQWWKLYQPLGFSVSNSTWLGTKAQLTSLCSEADKYDIKVIVDVVANHVANNGTDGGTYSYVNSGIESQLKNSAYFHTNNTRTGDDSRYTITQYHLGMPDLNTANTTVQSRVTSLLKECIDCGVDGFRFDAAKHIELPTDPSNCKSDFWPNVLNAATSYASQKGVAAPFYYGEILGSAGTDIGNYTTYMAVTDNYTGDRALDKAYWTAASELADSTYYKGASADKSVLWVESHDTYMGSSGSAYFSNTKGVSNDVLAKAWAIVGARADSTALYFARPNSTMGAASTDTGWKSSAVAEVNKFKNHFDGTSEYLASSGNTAYIERGTKGVVISKLDGSGSVSLTAHQMASGTYTDQITGNTFTVSNGTITGTVGSTGVAVVYNAQEDVLNYITASTLYLRPGSTWINAGGRYAMYFFNSATGATQWVSMTSAGDNYYSGSVPSGDWTNVIFCRMNGSNTTNSWDNKKDQTADLYPDDGTNCYNFASDKWSVYGAVDPTDAPATEPTVDPTEASGDTYTIYAANINSWSKMNVYYWGSSKSSVSWPGTAMEQGSAVFKAEIPSDATGVIFNDGSLQTVDIKSGIVNNAEWVVTTSTDSSGHYNVESGPTYYLVGSMNSWSNNSSYAFTLNTAETDHVEYKLSSITLAANAEMKVHDSKDTWYPGGSTANYTVTTAGTYDVYFRPNGDGGSGWYNGYFKLVNVTPCTVTWKNYDGTTLATDTVTIGTTPSYTGADPEKPSTAQYTYTFSGWSPAVTAVTGDVTYTAQFTESARTFTVTWKNYDGTVLETDENVAYGARPSFDGETPAREDEGATTYQFSGWSPQITDETTITEDTTYTARFSTDTKTYTITWVDGDGNILRTEPCIDGVTPHYTGATPTKTATAQYTYTFNSTWDPPLVAADRDTVYTAQFDAAVNTYTVTFKNDDGVVLQSSEVEYGTTPAYTGTAPAKASTLTNSFTFTGWSPEVEPVSGEATYTASYRSDPIGTYTVKATNVVEWDSVYVYYWGNGGDNTWPGIAMTADDDGFIYTASIPESAEGVIFTDGAQSGAKQTVNIESGITDGAHWAILDEKDTTETAKYKVHAVPTYYLVGTMTEWNTNAAFAFVPHKASDKVEEYKLSGVTLTKNGEIKVYGGDDTWYPSGSGTNYTVSADGTYNVYFRPNKDGNSDWYEKYFYLANVTPYTVTWKDGDGATLKTETVTYGETPAYTGDTPTKEATAQYTYTFNDTWSPAIAPVNADATYTAQFDSTVNTYTIRFVNEDGTELRSTEVAYGETPAYTGAIPTKADEDLTGYTFAGWEPALEAVSGAATYTATYTSYQKPRFNKHSLSLNGDIGMNFYLNLTDQEIADGAVVDFLWTVNYQPQTASVTLTADDKYSAGYKATVNVAVAEMTYDITATLKISGEPVATDTYSVKQYADTILNSSDFKTEYVKIENEEKYNKLVMLVKTMLEYGADAQTVFSRNSDHPANANVDYTMPSVTAEMIVTGASDMTAGLEEYGIEYAGSTIVYLTQTSLRHYYKIVDTAKFNAVKENITFNGVKVEPVSKSGQIYFQLKNIAAADLDELQTLSINGAAYHYSVLDYVKACLESTKVSDETKLLVQATYRYNEAANAFFG